MFQVGDIVKIYSSTAGHKKYHLCVLGADEYGVCRFLYINSHDGFEGDCAVTNAELPELPPSKTHMSVICCNTIARYNEKQLKIFRAAKLGVISKELAAKLLAHMQTVRSSLTRSEKTIVIDALTLLSATVANSPSNSG